MADAFSALPQGAKSVEPFTVSIPESSIEELKGALKIGKIPPLTYETSQEDRRYGVPSSWLKDAKECWLEKYDWYVVQSAR